jgi:ADP-ribose pyrophosphatase YjhB (NUDIX family)
VRNAIDVTWYRKPPGIHERTCAGGIVARRQRGSGPVEIALAVAGDGVRHLVPKGGVRRGETLAAAAAREIREELGLNGVSLCGQLGVRERLSYRRDRWSVTHYFLFVCRGSGLFSSPRAEFAIRWVDVRALPPMLWPEQEALIASVRCHIEGAFAGRQAAAPDPASPAR